MSTQPYDIIKQRYITEKTAVLEGLQNANSNKSLARCSAPKYVFLVDKKANKYEIASALEEIYNKQDVKVISVNTLKMKGKQKKRGKGRRGRTAEVKKAIVTMEAGDTLDNV